MNKTEFIERLSEKCDLSKDECLVVNDVLENHFIVGRHNQENIIFDLEDKLHINNAEAQNVYNAAMDIVMSEVENKLKHLFNSQD